VTVTGFISPAGFSLINATRLMADVPTHGITAGTTGRTAADIDYSLSSELVRAAEKKLLSSITGITAKNILFLNQIHGDDICVVESDPVNDTVTIAEADALVTTLPGICLVIRSADCVPILLYDNTAQVIAAVHSGWRGCVQGIAGKTVKKMTGISGTAPSDISALIMPSIGPASYQVGKDVADRFPGHTIERNKKLYVDLWSSVTESLIQAGVVESSIRHSKICTLENRKMFFTHRGGDQGRNLNFIFINYK
jgi:hypothetical protein